MRMTTSKRILPVLVAVAAAFPLAAAPADDEAAIRKTVLNYIEGWYAGDAARMEQALHPDLAKRIVVAQEGHSRLDAMSALALVQATRSGWGARTPTDQQRKDVEILDVFGDMASVKLTAREWVDYMHLGKVDGRWVIINVLWARRDASGAARSAP